MANKRFIARNGIDANGITVVNAADPVGLQDLVTKNYLINNSGLITSVGAVQVRRTTTYTTTATSSAAAVDLTFDIVDVVTDTTICNRDVVNTARLYAYQAGTYEITTELTFIESNTGGLLNLQYKKNGTTVLPQVAAQRPASTTSRDNMSFTALVTLAANDYLTLQAYHSSNAATIQVGAVVSMKKLGGVKGTDGAPGIPGGDSSFYYSGSSLDSPNSSNWAVNALAPLVADPSNVALNVRSFDDTLEEGVGFTVYVPPTATNITFTLMHKPSTAPVANSAVILRLYDRPISVGSAVGAWSTALQLNTVTIPTNNFYQTSAQTVTCASLGITPGTVNQFELTRQGGNASDTLVGDWHLFNLTVSFT